MDQYWKLLNISHKCNLEWESGMKLGEILFSHDPSRLASLLRVPQKPKPYIPPHGKSRSIDPRDLGQLGLIFDILVMIFESISEDRVSDLVCLTMTNTLLLPIGQKRIYAIQQVETALWQYSRIICIGDNLDGNDLPPNLLYEREKKELSGNTLSGGSRLYVHGSEGTILDYLSSNLHWQKKARSDDADSQCSRLSFIETEVYHQLIEPNYSWDGRPETEWILCNWRTGEYVRENAVKELSELLHPLSGHELTLGHVLLTQICWSTDNSADMAWEGPIHRGRWAGHRFAIISKEFLVKDPKLWNMTWTDVTAKILGEVKAIWACEFELETDDEGGGLEKSEGEQGKRLSGR